MEAESSLDLDYITERIITVSFPQTCPDQIYIQNLQEITQMLKSKHGHNYMVINLSEKNDSLTQLTHKVLDTGWLDGLAPSLEQICGVCKTMENWLQSHTQHILVIHCRGGQGRVGVIVSTYIHCSSTSASAGPALDHFAMRRFYNDKVSSLMTPSQKRYVWMFSNLLKGVMKMNPSPLFLLCVVLHSVPLINPDGGCCLFLRVYQNLQAVCTSAVYQVRAGHTDRVYFVLQPAQLLKGDIMIVCYDKSTQIASREVIFRLQFHTGIIHGQPLLFPKHNLDTANKDSRFPDDGKVELIFSESPDKLPGNWKNGPSVIVDYDILDPLVRHDSYEDISPDGQVLPPSPVPLNARLYTSVRKRSRDEGGALFGPIPCDLNLSASSDSGFFITSQWNGVSPRPGPSQEEGTQLRRVLSGVGPEPDLPPQKDMIELPGSSNGEGKVEGEEAGLRQPTKRQSSPIERETDILDDDVSHWASPASDRPSLASIGSFLPVVKQLMQSGNGCSTPSTHTTKTHTYPHLDGEEPADRRQVSPVDTHPLIGPDARTLPDMPSSGRSISEAVQKGGVGNVEPSGLKDSDKQTTHNTHTLCASGEMVEQEELAWLATDMDESIEQLNQLILDLDPSFIPVPTRHTPHPRSCSLYTNGVRHTVTHTNSSQSGWTHTQASDVTDHIGFYSPGCGDPQTFQNFPPIYKHNLSSSQHGWLSGMDSVDYEAQTSVVDTCDPVLPTPAFPVYPPTPYVKHFPAFPDLRTVEGQWEMSQTAQVNEM
ncbi:hypothetical protein UPYG_G00031450 [Umbra pygmaea]|uniref:Tensin 3 n=1 Tax=Umbra pygmaea TaxID=75934 RepID=A0ABD0XMU8_UMBPY